MDIKVLCGKRQMIMFVLGLQTEKKLILTIFQGLRAEKGK